MNNLKTQGTHGILKSVNAYNLHRVSKTLCSPCSHANFTHKTFTIINKKEVKS